MVFVFVDCDEGAGGCDFSYQGQFFLLNEIFKCFFVVKTLIEFCVQDLQE